METKNPTRVYYIDWLRVFAVILLVPFHTAMIFVLWGFHIKNGVLSPGLTYFNWTLNFWHMPLFMFLAGASTWYAMSFRGNSSYAKERVLRLLVPLLAGMAIIVPPQIYVERLWRHQFDGSFLSFYPSVFTRGFYPEGNLSWHHLWFLLYLFFNSMVAIPLFAYLRRDTVSVKVTAALKKLAAGPGLFIPALYFIAGQWAFKNGWPNGDQNFFGDLDNVFLYLSIFVLGYICSMSDDFKLAAIRRRYIAGAAAIASTAAAMLIDTYFDDKRLAVGAVLLAFSGTATWCWIIALNGFAAAHLNFTNRFLKYAAEAALPFYVLHQTVIIVIGFFVIKLNADVPVKFLLILIPSFIVTALIYELLGKRIPPFRFILGMKSRKSIKNRHIGSG